MLAAQRMQVAPGGRAAGARIDAVVDIAADRGALAAREPAAPVPGLDQSAQWCTRPIAAETEIKR
jgi:hypothetical protein